MQSPGIVLKQNPWLACNTVEGCASAEYQDCWLRHLFLFCRSLRLMDELVVVFGPEGWLRAGQFCNSWRLLNPFEASRWKCELYAYPSRDSWMLLLSAPTCAHDVECWLCPG